MTVNDNSGKKNEDRFSLYTENIVEKPFTKYKKVIKLVKLVLSAVVFGGVACLTFTLLFPIVGNLFNDSNNRAIINIPIDEYPEDSSSESLENSTKHITSQSEGTEAIYGNSFDLIHNNMVNSKKSIVTITVDYNGIEDYMNANKGANTSGLIIAETENEYVIMTDYSVIKDANNIKVTLNDATSMSAYILSNDTNTGLAFICASIIDNLSINKSKVKSAVLDNSYLVEQGDIVIACGKLMGYNSSVNYGIAVNVANGQSGIDSYFSLISTNITKDVDDFAYLFNMDGNVIGIMKKDSIDKPSSSINVYGISDLKSLIQRMINNSKITYLGVIGQNVTNNIAIANALPIGVYVAQVEENSPAFASGIQTGDVITMVNGVNIISFKDLSENLYRYYNGDSVLITAKRKGKDGYKSIDFNVTLSER